MEKILNFWYNSIQEGIAFVVPTCEGENDTIHFRYKPVNQAYAHTLRHVQEKLFGQRVEEYFLPGQEGSLLDNLRSVLETGVPQQLDLLYTWAPGDVVWLTIKLTRMEDQVIINTHDISEQKKSELDLQRRLAMESIIATISSRLVTLKAREVEEYIVEALEKISLHTGAERASVFQYSDDKQRGSCTHEWCAPGIASRKEFIQNVPITSFVWTYQQLEAGRHIQLETDNLDVDAVQERQILTSMSINTMFALPIIQDQKTHGFIAFYTICKAKVWDQNDISLLQTFCTLITSTLSKFKQAEAINRANLRLEGLREIDQALLSSRLSDRPPLIIALKYIHFMVPSERITVYAIDETTGLAVATCKMLDGVIDTKPDIALPASLFYNHFKADTDYFYFDNLAQKSAGLNDFIPNYEDDYKSVLILPLHYKGHYIGAFTLASPSPYFFTEEYRQITHELAGQLAIVLYQQQLDEQLEQYTDQLEQRVEERTREINRLSRLHRAILTHAGQAIISTDTTGVIQTANQACQNLLGFGIPDLIGKAIQIKLGRSNTAENYISFNALVRPEVTSVGLLDGLAADGTSSGEYKVLGKDGQQIPVLLAMSVLADEHNQTIGHVGIITDISAMKMAEAKLQQKNRELNTIFEVAIDLHGIISSTGDFIDVNRAWEVTLGYSLDELRPYPFWHVVHLDEQAAVKHILLLVSHNQPFQNQINQFQKKDGGFLILEWNAVASGDQIYVSCRDITQRQQSEAELRVLNKRLQLATQAAGQGIWDHDVHSNTVLWDDYLWDMFGFKTKPQKWTYEDFNQLIHPDDRSSYLQQSMESMKKPDNIFVAMYRIIRPDGVTRYIENMGLILRDEFNHPVRVIGLSWDITDRKLAEETLQESEARFREIAENVDEVFWIHSADPFRLLYVNPAYERIFNRSVQSLYDDPFSYFDSVLEDDQLAMRAFMDEYQQGKEDQIAYRIKLPDGSLRWLQIRTFAKRAESGKVIRHIGVASDITSQKEKELLLQQALLGEQKLNQLKSQFVSTASHEFRTPLTTMQTSVELIKLYLPSFTTGPTQPIDKHLAIIENEIHSFSLLLSDILTIGKIESGKVPFSPSWINIISLCENVIDTHFSQYSDSRPVHFSTKGLPGKAYVDEKLMSHVLINLLSNAFKFSHTSPILKLVFKTNSFFIQVIDEGIGIPADEIGTLFQAFFRASNSNGISGTGLGLVITKQFIELHGGQINVSSTENKRTTFDIQLPLNGKNEERSLAYKPMVYSADNH